MNISDNEKITQNDIIEIIDKKTKKVTTYDLNTEVRNIVKKNTSFYFKFIDEEYHESFISFAFKIFEINEDFIIIETIPMYEVTDGNFNSDNLKIRFKLTKNNKLCLRPRSLNGEEYELTIKTRKSLANQQNSNLENNYNPDSTSSPKEVSVGIFIDIHNKQELEKYYDEFDNKYFDQIFGENNIARNVSIYIDERISDKPRPKEIATDWILKQNNFKIISQSLEVSYGNPHDWDGYLEIEVIKEEFGYNRKWTAFKCEKDGKEFILIPDEKTIKINNIYYYIPVIEVHNYSPESLGLINIEELNLEYES